VSRDLGTGCPPALLAEPIAPTQVGRSKKKLDREQATLLDLRMARTLFMHFSGLMRLLPRRVCGVSYTLGPLTKLYPQLELRLKVGWLSRKLYVWNKEKSTKEKTQEGYFVWDDRSSARRNDYNSLL
jgi:hypothetical protein